MNTWDEENSELEKAVNRIIQGWGNYQSVVATAKNGIATQDCIDIYEICENKGLDYESVCQALIKECKARTNLGGEIT
jgi:hypothetical protein